jgi:carbamoyl-phosphate synthase small subunit
VKKVLRLAASLAGEVDESRALALANDFPGLAGMDLAKVVSAKAGYTWSEGEWTLNGYKPGPEPRFHVVAYDFGVKRNILSMLAQRGCKLTVVPAQTPAADVLAMNPDGIFLSNGPGDPEPCDYAIAAIREFLERGIPTFGICLGHQLLALASGAKTLKMKFGHHGANHPVKDMDTGQVLITSQNHGFAVDADSLPANLRPPTFAVRRFPAGYCPHRRACLLVPGASGSQPGSLRCGLSF